MNSFFLASVDWLDPSSWRSWRFKHDSLAGQTNLIRSITSDSRPRFQRTFQKHLHPLPSPYLSTLASLPLPSQNRRLRSILFSPLFLFLRLLISFFISLPNPSVWRWPERVKVPRSGSISEPPIPASVCGSTTGSRSSPTTRETAPPRLTSPSLTPSASSVMPPRTRSPWTRSTRFSVSISFGSDSLACYDSCYRAKAW